MHRRGDTANTDGGRHASDSDSGDDECDHSSNDDYSSDEDSSIYSDSDSEHSIPEETLYQLTAQSVVRRRHSPMEQQSSSEKRNDDDGIRQPLGESPTESHAQRSAKRGRNRHAPPNFFQECFMFYRDACPCLCNRRVNALLGICFVLWFGVQFHDAWTVSRRDHMKTVRKNTSRNRLRNGDSDVASDKLVNANRGFWGDAQQALEKLMPNSKPRTNKKKNKGDVLAEGCKRPAWQTLSFPNCNELHQFDLKEEFGLRRSRATTPVVEVNNSMETSGYVGAGLWRNVWKVRGPENMSLVIKMMKGEHDVDRRNFDRHRRDALSMERLTSSPNIVSIYGHCGNTVLTEHLPRGLDTLIYHSGDKEQNDTVATRQTPLGRLRLALQVARGVAAIHEIPGGPIVHADIQAKQFLVDAQGIVKLNDFNRCRFMPNNTKTGKPCTVRIPSSPGASRAPEEYNYDELTEALDVFSTAHVLYAILTGEHPWDDLWGSQIKKLVKAGNKPPVVDKKYLEPGTSDAALANLIDMAYEYDPQDRVSASKLVAELERLIATEEAK